MIPSFYRVQTIAETGSTNEDAKQAAQKGQAEGLVIKAKRQTAGKGRQGRAWHSPEGNLYMSLLLRPACTPQEAGLYSFVTALAVQDAVQSIGPSLALQLKWPNDVLIDGKKICGILLESDGAATGRIESLVIGVGINVAQAPEAPLYPATSLAAEGVVCDVDDVLEAFLNAFDHWRLTLQRDGFRPVRRAWETNAKGGAMKVRLPKGEKEGTFGGIDDRGCLILRLADGSEAAIEAGDVFF